MTTAAVRDALIRLAERYEALAEDTYVWIERIARSHGSFGREDCYVTIYAQYNLWLIDFVSKSEHHQKVLTSNASIGNSE